MNVFRYVLSRLYIDCSPVSSLFVVILAEFFFCNKEKNMHYRSISNSDEYIKYSFHAKSFHALVYSKWQFWKTVNEAILFLNLT